MFNYSLNVSFFLILYITIPLTYIAYKTLKKRISWLEFRVMVLTFMAVNGISPLLVLFSDGIDLENMDYFFFTVYAFSMAAFIVVYELTPSAKHHPAAGKTKLRKLFRLNPSVGYLIFFLGISGFFFIFKKYGILFFTLPKHTIHLLYTEMGIERLSRDFISAGALLVAWSCMVSRKHKGIAILFVTSAVILCLSLKMRSAAAGMIISTLYLYHKTNRSVTNASITLCVLAVFVFVGVFHEINAFLYGKDYSFVVDSDWMMRNVAIFKLHSWYLIWKDVEKLDPLYGVTIVNAFKSALMPAFAGGEVRSLAVWYANNFLSSTIDAGGAAFSMVVEAYMNFKFLGPITLLGLLGFITRKLDTMYNNRGLYVRCFLVSVVPKIFMGDLSSFLKMLTIYVFFIYVVSFVLNCLFDVRKNRHTARVRMYSTHLI